jgi:hypothetical protein
MEILLSMILPGVLLPLILSTLCCWLILRYPEIQWSVALIWLPSYVWLSGVPTMPPSEAIDWLWLLAITSVLLSFKFKSRLFILVILQTMLLALMLIIVAWPVLQYQLSMMLLFELCVVFVTAGIIYYVMDKSSTPVLSMTISSGGLGLAVALGGSLLIGQLAGALAATLGVFAIHELVNKCHRPTINSPSLMPVIQLYLVILVIARIFADISLGVASLLLAAPLLGLIPTTRYAVAFSAAAVITAISWLVLTADFSGYY